MDMQQLWDAVSDIAFKAPHEEPTRKDEEKEASTLSSTVAPTTEQRPNPGTAKAKLPPNKSGDIPEVTHSDLSSWVDAGTDMLGSITAVGEKVSTSLLEQAEKAASTGLASIHGKLDMKLDASEPVLKAANDLSHPTVTLGISQETMMLVFGLAAFIGVEVYYLSRR